MTGPAARLRAMVQAEQLAAALGLLAQVVGEASADARLAGTAFPFPELDEICGEIGRLSAFDLLHGQRKPVGQPHDLVVVTEAFVQGGHVEILRDLADWSERPLVVACTNLYGRERPVLAEIAAHPRVARVIVLDEPDLLGRLRGLQALVAHPAAIRILVLCHAHDAVGIAAVAPVADKTVLFFHHCDHTPCLGCFLPHAVHVDLHNLALDHCRSRLGIAGRYVCLTSREVGGVPRGAGRPAEPVFKTATCGSEHKLVRLRYPIGYAEVVVRLVAVRRGVHYHVGLLSDEFVHAVKAALQAAHLPPDAFVHVGHVGNFRGILAALEADLYVPTLPQAGGKALVDAMGAGVPILVHENAVDRLWGGRDLVYPSAPRWGNLDELDTALRRFDEDGYWAAQAAASRAHFDRHHAPALFARLLRASGSQDGATGAPPLAPYRPDFDLRARALGMGA